MLMLILTASDFLFFARFLAMQIPVAVLCVFIIISKAGHVFNYLLSTHVTYSAKCLHAVYPFLLY